MNIHVNKGGRGHRGYSDDQIDLIASLMQEGCSAGQIASRVPWETTRNAIIGIVYRNRRLSEIGFLNGKARVRGNQYTAIDRRHRTPERKRPAGSAAPRRLPSIPTFKAVEIVETKLEDLRPLMVQIEDLQSHQCRWPIGDPRTDAFAFCGHPKRVGSSYCPTHWRLSCG